MIPQENPLSKYFQELIKRRRGVVVSEQFLLGRLAVLLVEHSELEGVHQDVLVEGGYQGRSIQTHHRHEVIHVHLIVQNFRHSLW